MYEKSEIKTEGKERPLGPMARLEESLKKSAKNLKKAKKLEEGKASGKCGVTYEQDNAPTGHCTLEKGHKGKCVFNESYENPLDKPCDRCGGRMETVRAGDENAEVCKDCGCQGVEEGTELDEATTKKEWLRRRGISNKKFTRDPEGTIRSFAKEYATGVSKHHPTTGNEEEDAYNSVMGELKNLK